MATWAWLLLRRSLSFSVLSIRWPLESSISGMRIRQNHTQLTQAIDVRDSLRMCVYVCVCVCVCVFPRPRDILFATLCRPISFNVGKLSKLKRKEFLVAKNEYYSHDENGLAFEGSMCDGRGNKSVLGHPEGSFLSLERNGKRTFLSHTHAHKYRLSHTHTLSLSLSVRRVSCVS